MKKRISSFYICIGIGINQLLPEWLTVYEVDKNPIVSTIGPNWGEVSSSAWKNASSFVKNNKGKSRRRNT